MDKDKDTLLDELLSETPLDEIEDDGTKIASDVEEEISLDDISEDQFKKLASISYELGRVNAISWSQEVRRQASENFRAIGLTPENIKIAMEKQAAEGLTSSPVTDMYSEVINFIVSKIHPIMMMNNYRPGAGIDKSKNSIDPDNHPMGKENVVIADKRRIQNVTEPTNVFGLKKKTKK